jgi:thiol-disulfide isomerase/thioredoxin
MQRPLAPPLRNLVMDLALLLARLLLAAVFTVAGLAKLADLPGSRQAVRDFGAPARLAAPLGFLLPVAELAVAIALIPNVSAWWGALGALVLLLVFVAGIGASLARGKHPDCHCFCQIHSRPASWPTLVRNGVLAVVATFILWQGAEDPGKSVVEGFEMLSSIDQVSGIVGLAALALLAAGGWGFVHLLGQNRRLAARLDALEPQLMAIRETPSPAPEAASEDEGPDLSFAPPAAAFALPGLHGETWTLDALRAMGKPVLLVFSDPKCGPCNALMPDLARWQQEHAASLTIAIISRGSADANRAKAVKLHLQHLLLQQDREVAEAYQANRTPSAVLVRPNGTIGSHVAAGAQSIRVLVAETVGTPAPVLAPAPIPVAPAPPPVPSGSANGAEAALAPAGPFPPRVGDPAPVLTFPDLEGRAMSVAGFPDYSTLVLFWNPGCGFCQQMLPDLKALEENRPAGAPKLLVVSTGTVEANRALGLHAPIVLDQGFVAGKAFGASGTPSAVLVDAQGRIASPLAVGAPGVLALARGEGPSPAGAPGNDAEDAPVPAAPLTPKAGNLAPALTLPALDGTPVNLADLRGQPTLVLFWNPGCGFCARMLEDLKVWEANPPQGAPRLVVVSTDDIETNQAMGLKSPVLLDQGFAAGQAFGTSGTPTAVLIDAEGRIASPIAAGAPAVLALANGRDPANEAVAANDSRPQAPQVGDPAPALSLPDLAGNPVTLDSFRGERTVVLFWNPGCGFCQRMLDDLKTWEATPSPQTPRLLVVSTGDPQSNELMGLASTVVLDQGFATGQAFGATGTPSAVLVDEADRIGSPLVVGGPAVLSLLAGQPPKPAEVVSNGTRESTPPSVGDSAPAVRLPDLSGQDVDLEEFRGANTLLLFWNPGCGFCARMLDDLRAWEANPPDGAPKLLIVSQGDAEANRAMGLRSPVVLDQAFTTGRAFGVRGTPSAVLVDAEGAIASGIATGARAVLALAGAGHAESVIL